MVKIKSLNIFGSTPTKSFKGTIEFSSGLQIFAAKNGYGKSSIYAGLIWGLGLENLYVVRSGDPTALPEALRDRVSLFKDIYEEVKSCTVELKLEDKKSNSMLIQRAVLQNQHNESEVTFTEKDETKKSKVKHGWGTAQDEIGGFPNILKKFMGLRSHRLMTSHGNDPYIYLENLAPLFMIDQLEGWTNIQAQQILRYSILQVYQGAIESLLGLDDRLERRLLIQKSEQEKSRLRSELKGIYERLNKITSLAGSDDEKTLGNKKIKDLQADAQGLDLAVYLSESINWTYENERSILSGQINTKKEQLDKLEIPEENASLTKAISNEVILLRRQIHDKKIELEDMIGQLKNQESLLSTISKREDSSNDLLILKKEGVGFPKELDCPTCHNSIRPENFNLISQDVVNVETYIASLSKEKALLKSSIHGTGIEITRLNSWLEDANSALRLKEQKLENINSSISKDRRMIVQITSDLSVLESKLSKNDDLNTSVKELQEELKSWARIAEKYSSIETEGLGSTPQRISDFESLFRKHLFLLKHSSLSQDHEDGRVTLDSAYNPLFEGRRLRTLGSASDQARLILAYTSALMITALRAGQSINYPGFIVYDEPYQQNPDESHKTHLASFFKYLAVELKEHQVIIFTSLPTQERTALQDAGIKVIDLPGENFLQTIPSAAKIENSEKTLR